MSREFNDRIAAQRKVLKIVNQKPWAVEPLFGLSSKAVDRWVAINRIDSNSLIVIKIRDISAKLFFLANKSQDQVSSEYRMVHAAIILACDDIQGVLERSVDGSQSLCEG